jgi:hypothetical protein
VIFVTTTEQKISSNNLASYGSPRPRSLPFPLRTEYVDALARVRRWRARRDGLIQTRSVTCRSPRIVGSVRAGEADS